MFDVPGLFWMAWNSFSEQYHTDSRARYDKNVIHHIGPAQAIPAAMD